MMTLKVDTATGDLTHGSLKRLETLTSFADIAKQNIWIRLNINRGEWDFDHSVGVPWIELFNNQASPEQFRAEVQYELERCKEIESIEYVRVEEIDRAIRKLKISYKAVLADESTLETALEVVA